MEQNHIYSSQEFQYFFKSSSRSLVLKANPPDFTIVAVSDDYLNITHKQRADVLGNNLFEVYPGSQADPAEKNSVYSSFMRAIHTKETDVLPTFKYEILVGNTGKLKTEYWSNVNEPLLDDQGGVAFIINTTTNITNQIEGELAITEALEKSQALRREQSLNEELQQTQQHLQSVLEELEERVAKRTKAFQQSEARFRLIIEQAPIAIAIFRGPQFVIEVFNDKVLEYWGRSAEQVKNVPLFSALPEASGQGFEELLTNVLTTGERFVASELPVTLSRNGVLATTWINFIYDPLRDENGDITGIMVVCNEITEQVNARKQLETIIEEKTELESNLRENQKRLQGILDTMAEGVGIIDTTGKLVYANSMAQRILGLTESEVKERTYNDSKWQNLRVDGSPLPQSEHPMTITMSTGMAIYDCEIGIKPPDREVFYISINAAPILDHEGKLTGGIGTFMDVTNRRKLLEQKDEFISVASHELKTPLTALKASTQLLNSLKDDLSSPFIPRLITQASGSVNKLNALVNDLLDVNRIQRGQLLLRKTQFSIADMINDCCQHVRAAGTHDIILQGDKSQIVCADEQRINQVMINFVNNAVKYAPNSKQISVLVETIEDTAKVSVTDFGPGIPKEKVPLLFDRYYRADYNVGQGGGLGLGLYISSEIIESHGGKIGVESEENKGSTFWFTLPLLEECESNDRNNT